jgi:two-component system OmpR family sensor kinase
VTTSRPKPLHRQVTVLAATVLFLALALSGTVVHLAVAAYLQDRLDARLRDTPIVFLSSTGDGQGFPSADHDNDPSTGPQTTPYLRLDDPDGIMLRSQAGRDAGQDFTADLPSALPTITGDAAFFDSPSREHSGPQLRVKVAKNAQGQFLIVALPRTDTDTVVNRLRTVQLSVSAGALLLGAATAYWLLRNRLSSLRRLAHAVELLRPEDPAVRVRVDNATREIHELALATNALLQRVQDAAAKEHAVQERLRQFIADASHELRTPITAVSAYAQLFELGAKDNPADLARAMAGIQLETVRMKDLTEALLTLATTEDHGTAETQPVEVTTVIHQAVEAATAVDPRWPITVTTDPGITPVEAEPAQLRQVLDNLIGNVRTHTPPGTTTHIRARQQATDVVITVADDGPGLTDDERAHMFDRFWRKDASRSRKAGGSGLGLAIVASIVVSWNGTVTATPSPDRGLTVTLSLPSAG